MNSKTLRILNVHKSHRLHSKLGVFVIVSHFHMLGQTLLAYNIICQFFVGYEFVIFYNKVHAQGFLKTLVHAPDLHVECLPLFSKCVDKFLKPR
jgi:hypothetical protein